ncbi:MAG: leucine-rich repeat domain-containing protein, partial [Clostridia bacterium]|nr:leucine-rich repeat domain-containing protein [Clostridia bacterium]
SLVEINLPSTLTLISDHAFMDCTSLAQIELPSGLKSIGEFAFAFCPALKLIVIPRSVEIIGSLVFEEASNIVIYCEAPSKPSGWEEDWSGGRLVYWGYEGDGYWVWFDD